MEAQQYNNTNQRVNNTNSEVLKIRLLTNQLLTDLELFLRGEIISEVLAKDGSVETKRVNVSNTKANETGIAEIMSWVKLLLNPQSVQGNFFEDKFGRSKMYDRYIHEIHGNLNDNILLNIYNWGIDDSDYDNIISKIMAIVQPFFTRLIANKERESYGESIRSSESHVVNNSDRRSIMDKLMTR